MIRYRLNMRWDKHYPPLTPGYIVPHPRVSHPSPPGCLIPHPQGVSPLTPRVSHPSPPPQAMSSHLQGILPLTPRVYRPSPPGYIITHPQGASPLTPPPQAMSYDDFQRSGTSDQVKTRHHPSLIPTPIAITHPNTHPKIHQHQPS